MRLKMARALLQRAKEKRSWIGDDHGDPYEAALKSEQISDEFQLSLKELFEHLRSALDYCAMEIYDRCGSGKPNAKIYFPITSRGTNTSEFPAVLKRVLPGIVGNRPDMVTLLASFQPFGDPGNDWLPDLSMIVNRAKHCELALGTVPTGTMESRDTGLGSPPVTILKADGKHFAKMPLLRIVGKYTAVGMSQVKYLSMQDTGEELLHFLSTAIEGEEDIIDKIEATL